MTSAPAPSFSERIPEPVIDAAITWALRLDYNAPTADEQRAFERWLEADALHVTAWQRLHSLVGFRADLDKLPSRLALDTLRAAQGLRQRRGVSRRNALKFLSSAGVVTTVGWMARKYTPWQRVLADASTAVGEQKALHLPDGSTIMLNTDSAISSNLAGTSRLVELRRGEISITTGADSSQMVLAGSRRPFWVVTPFGRMQALGTRFIVRLEGERARISVQEGAVELHPARAGQPAIVRAGESRWLTTQATWAVGPQSLEADAWVDGIVAGKDMRLEDLLAELSRYRVGRIVCEPQVADLRLSGLFHVKDTDRALRFLAETQPITVSYRTRFWITVGPRSIR